MRRLNARWIVIAAALLAAGCASQKEPAEKVIAQVESAVAAIKEEATKYAPDALKGVESSIAATKEKLAKGDFKGVLADATPLNSAVSELKETIEQKKAEAEVATARATEQWNSLSADVPKMVDAIQSRVDILGKSHKLPKNVSQEAFDAAKTGLDSMKTSWQQATSAFATGDVVTAAAIANNVKQQGTEVLQMLGMTSG